MQTLVQYYTDQYTMWFNKYLITQCDYDKQQALSFLTDLKALTK